MLKLENILKVLILVVVVLIFTKNGGDGVVEGIIPDPYQKNLEKTKFVTIEEKNKEYKLELLAEYKIEGIVKSKKRYLLDIHSSISPYDLVFAWGELNKSEVDEHIRYSQNSRWYYYRYKPDSIVDKNYIALNSANNHIIPANKYVFKQLKRIEENAYIILEGYLVDISLPDGGNWTSSLKRDDTGNKSCEVMYVTKVTSKEK